MREKNPNIKVCPADTSGCSRVPGRDARVADIHAQQQDEADDEKHHQRDDRGPVLAYDWCENDADG